MYNKYFGDIFFNTGWKTKIDINLFENNHNITVKAKAYFETDAITSEQETSFDYFKENCADITKTIEPMLLEYSSNALNRFIPKELLFQRNGEYALLFDDIEDEDGGIAVCLKPNKKIMLQDEYL